MRAIDYEWAYFVDDMQIMCAGRNRFLRENIGAFLFEGLLVLDLFNLLRVMVFC